MKSNWSPLVLTRVSLAALVAALLLACGGESAAPPAPPTPPPFQPQTVVVQLGTKGGATTLISTQAGGWTRNGQAFTSGSEVTGENAAKYKLTLANGTWTAEFVPPDPVPLALGISGDAVSLQAQEDGSFQLDGEALTSGTVVGAKNGNQYKLVLGSDGDWMAEFVPPNPQRVTLGTSGESRQIGRVEDGGYTLDGATLATGTVVTAQNQNQYTLTLGTDGTWSAAYVQPAPQQVQLGTTGDAPLLVYRQENGTYLLNGEQLLGGRVVTASNGQSYRLSLRTDGWHAVYQSSSVSVRLGTSGGSVNLTRNEDGTWMRGTTTFSSGDSVTGVNGFEYRLTLGADGSWIVEPVPATISVAVVGSDTTIELARHEDGTYRFDNVPVASGDEVQVGSGDATNTYRLRYSNRRWTATFIEGTVAVALGTTGDSIPLTKRADGTYYYDGRRVRNASVVRSPNTGVRYRLSLSNGVWTSSVYIPPTTDPGDGGGGTDPVVAAESIMDALPTNLFDSNGDFQTDNARQAGIEPTDSNGVKIDYSPYGGSGRYEDDTFVESALRAIDKILGDAERLADGTDSEQFVARVLVDTYWGDVKTALDAIFEQGHQISFAATPPKRSGETDLDDALGDLKDLKENLSDVARFKSEYKTQIDAAITDDPDVTGDKVFNARKRVLALGSSSNTRFGAVSTLPTGTTAEAVAGGDGRYTRGAFAFSPLEDSSTANLPSRGTARYSGRTWAISPDSVLYTGSIELLASVGIEQVTATISNLRRSDNNASWVRGNSNRPVREIQLSEVGKAAFHDSNGSFGSISNSKVVYDEFGGLFSEDVANSSHTGQFVGVGQSAGTAVIGTWNVNDGELKGSYGAERSTINRVTFPSSSSDVTYVHDPNNDGVAFDKTNKTVAVDGFTSGDPFSLSTLSPPTKSSGTLRATIRLGKTSFTGFGVWKLVQTNTDPDTVTTGFFAYSSLAKATYTSADERYYPGRVRAQYEGDTMATDGSGNIYSGSYALNVTWSPGSSVGGTLTAAISNLRTVIGSNRFTIGGNGVSQIGFEGSISTVPDFSSPNKTTVQFTDNTKREFTSGQAHSGVFVGEGIDGPYGVVGNWKVESISDVIKGAFGADLVLAP